MFTMRIFCSFWLCLLAFSSTAFAKEDSLSTIRFIELTKQLEQHKKDSSADTSDNPHTFKQRDYVVQLGGWRNYLRAGLSKRYFINSTEWQAGLYAEQFSGDLTQYSLITQQRKNCLQDIVKGCLEQQTFTDLGFSVLSFGINGTLYYLSTPSGSFALGFEVPLLAMHQLKITSKGADSEYNINGISFLGIPIHRHSVLTPLKLRFAPTDRLRLVLAAKYAILAAHQPNYTSNAENAEGERFGKCSSKDCTFQTWSGFLGIELAF